MWECLSLLLKYSLQVKGGFCKQCYNPCPQYLGKMKADASSSFPIKSTHLGDTMKTCNRFVAALALCLAFSAPALADGQMPGPGVADPIAEAAIVLVQAALSLF
jgi:hypothetical protein